ncbi:MAG: NAD(P)H-hydrate dehydratase [Rikenellaceae bacterium]|nr:NAD(P)H-hydrate dehydratase [Rikenellaceae bacterium]
MKILTGNPIREADRYTITHEPISSIELMERAARQIADFLIKRYAHRPPLIFFTGKGNNGADGLAVARMMSEQGYPCTVYTLFAEQETTEEYRINLHRLPAAVRIEMLPREIPLHPVPDAVFIDALLGTGTEKPAEGIVAETIRKMNLAGRQTVSIDIPSGMAPQFSSTKGPIVEADITLTLQYPKLSLLLPESGEWAGEVVILPIGLSETFLRQCPSPYYYVTPEDVQHLMQKRPKFAHKGEYGHALLIAGSVGMTGAAVLSTGGALRSGCGLVTVHVPKAEHLVMHITHPAALVSPDRGNRFTEIPHNLEKYTAIGIGSGMGQAPETFKAFKELLEVYRHPMVLDADALNILAARRELLPAIPAGSVLTPHVGELKRLIGPWESDREKLEKTTELAAEIQSHIVVKGAYTTVCSPTGQYWINSTGNPGMAKGGSGDVLMGLTAGLLAQGMDAGSAATLAVYVHGKAGDTAAEIWGQESMNAEDIAKNLIRLD